MNIPLKQSFLAKPGLWTISDFSIDRQEKNVSFENVLKFESKCPSVFGQIGTEIVQSLIFWFVGQNFNFQGGNSQNFFRQICKILDTFRCFYKAIIHVFYSS